MSYPRISDIESRFGGDSDLAPGTTNDPAAPWNAAPDEEDVCGECDNSGIVDCPDCWVKDRIRKSCKVCVGTGVIYCPNCNSDSEEEAGEIFLL